MRNKRDDPCKYLAQSLAHGISVQSLIIVILEDCSQELTEVKLTSDLAIPLPGTVS